MEQNGGRPISRLQTSKGDSMKKLDPRTATARDVIAIANSRGLLVTLRHGPPIQPVLEGAKEEKTDALMEALKAFRTEIIAELQK